MSLNTEIEELRIWIGNAEKGMNIDLEDDDQISIIYEEGCMGEYCQTESDFITAKDLFEIIDNKRAWALRQADTVTTEKIKQLSEEKEKLKAELERTTEQLEKLTAAIEIINERKKQ